MFFGLLSITTEKKRGQQSGAGECTKSWGIQLILDFTMSLVGSRLERRPNVIDQKMVNKKNTILSTQLVSPSWAHCSALKSNGWPRSYGVRREMKHFCNGQII